MEATKMILNKLENAKNGSHSEPSGEAIPQSLRRSSLCQVAAMGMEMTGGSQDFQVRKREDFQVTVSVLVFTTRRTRL